MANPRYNKTSQRPTESEGGEGGETIYSSVRRTGASGASVNEKTVNWPGLPGKSGPNRSAGVTKAKIYPKSEGL